MHESVDKSKNGWVDGWGGMWKKKVFIIRIYKCNIQIEKEKKEKGVKCDN